MTKSLDIFAKTIILQKEIENTGTLVLRVPMIEDLENMTEYINTLSQEKTFITFQGEEISLESEKAFLEAEIKNIKEKKNVMLLAYLNEVLVGIGAVRGSAAVTSHIGILGISIQKEYRDKGIGKILFSAILEETEKNLPIRIITLEVFANNPTAQELYESFGFIEYGRLPGGIHHKEKYVDNVLMYKKI